MTRQPRHEVETYGAKKYVYGTDTQEKRRSVQFRWEVGNYNLPYNFPTGKAVDATSAIHVLNQIRLHLEKFADFAGVSIEEIDFSIGYNHGYYDDVEVHYSFSVHRDENDEEYEARKILIREAAQKAAETKRKNKIAKVEKEKKELERLLKKYGDKS